jgi:membrane-bound lytic murein transglycosylase B
MNALLLRIIPCLFFCWSHVAVSHPAFLDMPEVTAFIQEMVKKHHFNQHQLEGYFQKASVQTSALSLITKPAEAKPWHAYRPIFINDLQIKNGVNFYKTHKKTLLSVEKTYGVPAEIIVAIIGAETRYGAATGKFPVFDTLSTLAFHFPRRADFFRQELCDFLLIAREEKLDIEKVKGSYAGAIGAPQFMPSSYRHYAVSPDKTGKRDLFHMDTAISSVAHYFKKHGWKTQAPVTEKATVKGDDYLKTQWAMNNPKPIYHYSDLVKIGLQTQDKAFPWTQEAMTLLPLKSADDHTEFWIGFHNFYVITRYNHSTHYAMAVYQLSQALKEQWQKA